MIPIKKAPQRYKRGKRGRQRTGHRHQLATFLAQSCPNSGHKKSHPKAAFIITLSVFHYRNKCYHDAQSLCKGYFSGFDASFSASLTHVASFALPLALCQFAFSSGPQRMCRNADALSASGFAAFWLPVPRGRIIGRSSEPGDTTDRSPRFTAPIKRRCMTRLFPRSPAVSVLM